MSFRHTLIQPNYDSVFEPAAPGRPARLAIRLKVTLEPLDPSVAWTPARTPLPGAPWGAPPPTHLADSPSAIRRGLVADYQNSRQVSCRSWLKPEWNAFKIRFKQAVEHAWNNQMVLLPTESGMTDDDLSDTDFRQLVTNPNIQAHVEPVLEIALMPMGVAGHARMEVAYLEQRGSHFRNWMNRITNESVQFARHGSNSDTFKDWTTGQITAAHEVGHWLRDPNARHFGHIDAGAGSRQQYGRTLGRRSALMGAGSLATQHEAHPWLMRMRRQSPMKLGWTMMHKMDFAKIQHEIPERQKRLMRT